MDELIFDRLTLRLGRLVSRRIAVAGLGALMLPGPVEAKKRRKRKKRKKNKKKKITLNEFGCVNVGSFCQSDDQCCSGICEGKKDNKHCQAHDTGGCQPGADECVEPSPCPGAVPLLRCFRTTGNASVCGISGEGACVPCAKDADCEADYGPGAACVICPGCSGDTFCVPTAQ